jgi:cob(I)alamin adenosyltransferase
VVRIYTRTGDDGTTGLLYGGRVPKWSAAIEANGAVDEAQAAIGVARAEVAGSALDELLLGVERDLWVLMAEVATEPEHRGKLAARDQLVTAAMVEALEARIDEVLAQTALPAAFVVPGANRASALLDLARTVVRRAERQVMAHLPAPDSLAGRYLNRLSDLLWALARAAEGEDHPLARQVAPRAGGAARDSAGGPSEVASGPGGPSGEDEEEEGA